MAKKRIDANIADIGSVEERNLSHCLDYAYVRYSTHAIMQRAIPDARDGLKPAQRRLVYAMYRLGLAEGTNYTKCAKICGQTSGDYHPHGESVLYPTLVRMVQDWVLRYPLISGQGNFGTVDGLDAAAMRYTAARLSPYGIAAVDHVSEDAVPFKLNYTETELEPTVLPGLFPNLLCNGSSGIAVGVACNFAPHNLREVAAVIRECATHPNVSVDRLLELMPGPDFPTGGVLRGQSTIKQYYTTGKGTVTIDGAWTITKDNSGNPTIVIHQLPYGSAPDKLAQQVAELVQSKRLDGVTDLKELSHRKDSEKCIHIALTLTKSANEDVIVKTLLKHTCLRATFSINQTAIVNSKAGENISLAVLARSYYEHRLEILRRCSEAEVVKLKQRIHILEGLASVCTRIREAVNLILESNSPQDARESLIANGFVHTNEQATAVLDISLKKLTRMEINQLLGQKEEAERKAKKLEKLLSSKTALREAVLKQLDDFAAQYGDERRTAIGTEAETVTSHDLISSEHITVVVNRDGYVHRLSVLRGTPEEPGILYAESNTLSNLVFVTNHGMAYCRPGHEIPEPGRNSKGIHTGQLLGCKPNETVIAIYDLNDASKRTYLLATSTGYIKRMHGKHFITKKRPGIALTKTAGKDTLIAAILCQDGEDVFIATSRGKGIRYPTASVPLQGRLSTGVSAMRLATGDTVAQITVMEKDFDGYVFFITSLGYVKKTAASKFRCYSGRTAIGMNTVDGMKVDRTGLIVGMAILPKNGSFTVRTKDGEVVTLDTNLMRDSEKLVRKVTPNEGDELVAVV